MKTLQELTAIKDAMRKEMALRLGKEADGAKYEKHVLMCGGTGCTSSGSMKIADELERQLEAKLGEETAEALRKTLEELTAQEGAAGTDG